MKTTFFTTTLLVVVAASLFSQTGSINNTLGTGGSFNVKDGSTTFLSLSQSNGYLSLNKSLTLPLTTTSALGVIFKGPDRFMHDYKAPGSVGYNTFVGVNSGNFTMSAPSFSFEASYNSAVGYSSLTALTIGYGNSAFGLYSLAATTAGDYNSAFGIYSLYNTTGSDNTAMGTNAGANLTTGSNNTLIGNNAQPSVATVSNEIVLGNSGITALRCQVNTITALSDARDKKHIKDLPLGLDFLMSVKPRSFNWDRREWYEDGKPDGSKMRERATAGFIAQELDEVQTKEQAEWLNLVLKSNPDRLEATPGNLLPIMVKAIQELKKENNALRNELVALRASIVEQVKNEVRSVLLKAVQTDDKSARVSLNETKN